METNENNVFQNEYKVLNKAEQLLGNNKGTDNVLLDNYKELCTEYRKLLQQSASLVRISDKQQDRLYKLQSDLKNLLNSMCQGILTVSDELIVNKGYSQQCNYIFEKKIDGYKFTDLISSSNDENATLIIESILNKEFFDGDYLKRKVMLQLLPNELYINDKYYRMQCKPVEFEFKGTKENAFMIILTDITEKKEIKKQLENEKRIFKSITRIVSDITAFSACVKDYRQFYTIRLPNLLEKLENNTSLIINEIIREVHTFKGNFLIYEIPVFTDSLEKIEQILADLRDKDTQNAFELRDILLKLDFQSDLDYCIIEIQNIIGNRWQIDKDFVIVDLARFKEVEEDIREVSKDVYAKYVDLRLVNICDLFSVYPEYTLRMAERVGKSIKPFSIENNDEIRVDNEIMEDFARSLVHIFRNIVDHGIESIDDRIEKSKSFEGNVSFKVSLENDDIKITISDDGNGIRIDSIKNKLISKKIKSVEECELMPDSEVIEYIFMDGLSTAEPISTFSGRGAGLAAVKDQTLKLGGRIIVKSAENEGTSFEIYLPHKMCI